MTYEKFINELNAIGFRVPKIPEKSDKKKKHSYDLTYGGLILYSLDHCADPWNAEPALVLSWSTGGITGGSCWDTGNSDPHYAYSSGEVEPNWDDLDRMLEHFCPNISHLKYKGIISKSIADSITEHEYYGNSHTHALRVLKLKDLWAHMNENNLFENANE